MTPAPPAKDVNAAHPLKACVIWPADSTAALVLTTFRLRNALIGAPAAANCVMVMATSVPVIVVCVLDALLVAVIVDEFDTWPNERMVAASAAELRPNPHVRTAAAASFVQEVRAMLGVVSSGCRRSG